MSQPHKADVAEILDPWVDRPAGLFFRTLFSLKNARNFGVESTVSDEDRRHLLKDVCLIESYI